MQHNETLVQEPAQKRRQGSLKKGEKVRHYYTDFFICVSVCLSTCACVGGQRRHGISWRWGYKHL